VSDSSLPPAARREFLAGVREIAPALLGMIPFGIITGVAAVGAGMTPAEAITLSLIMFSGIGQLVFAQLFAVQSPLAVTLLAIAVVSLRHLMYSAAFSPHLAHLTSRWRMLLAYLMTDQGFAMGVERFNQPGERTHRHLYVFGVSLTLYVPWQISVAAGALAGAQVPTGWSLDFVVTLTFLGLLVPALRTRADIAAATIASAVALAVAGAPYKLALVAASLAGIAAGIVTEKALRR
jgi:4-azaleucine resistance transporter AzlC